MDHLQFCIFVCLVLSGLANAELTQHEVNISRLSNDKHLQSAVSEILKPRVVGSSGHAQVRAYIMQQLTSMDFDIEIDSFQENTPIFPNLTFSNVIGKFNPYADSFLTLACHYDSKYFSNIPNFLGAIDSAVPCAIMLNIAKVLHPYLQQTKNQNQLGLMLIFFDGEEAFLQWNESDSVYGSRHLAKRLSYQIGYHRTKNQIIRDIDRIDVLVLLDLIGAANSKFYSFYSRTHPLHNRLERIERELDNLNLIEGKKYQFFSQRAYEGVDDDHRPFLRNNVPILHLIATPFPPQWHKPEDNAEHLDWPSIKNVNRVLRVFVYQYIVERHSTPNLRNLPAN